MANCNRITAAFLLLLCSLSCLQQASALGVNYGELGNNLLPPNQVVSLLKSNHITKARMFSTNPEILTAFADSGIELVVTVENNMLSQISSPENAITWITTHIKPYLPATKIAYIMMGNELDATEFLPDLVPALSSTQQALAELGLDIKVSTPFSYGVMGESYPPSAGSFTSDVSDVMSLVLQLLNATNTPFWINAYPYFAYKGDSKDIPLDYALFNNGGTSAGVTDPNSNLSYDNLLYAQIDAVISAIKALGYVDMEVKVGESGWPSNGDADELGASLENASIYNGNLLKRQLAKEGTPMQANLDIYIFALFNENQKPGPTSERNFGLFHPDGTVAYNAGLIGFSNSTTSAPKSTAGSISTPSEPPSSDTNPSEPSSPPAKEAPVSTEALSPPTPSLSENPITYSSAAKTTTGGWTKLIIKIFCVLLVLNRPLFSSLRFSFSIQSF